MLELLKMLFIGHIHKWEVYSETKYRPLGRSEETTIVCLRCEECGKMINHAIEI
jgi:hypothetical protein